VEPAKQSFFSGGCVSK